MAKPISFASFNLYNFQAVGKQTYRGHIVSADEYEAKKEWTCSMLSKIDADVIAFQELWSKSCLEDVLSASGLTNYTAHYIKKKWYNTAVAIAVKTPWEVTGDAEVIKDFPFDQIVKTDDDDGEDDALELNINKFSRSVLKVRLKHKNSSSTPEIVVFACHLKSKLPSGARGFAKPYQTTVGSAMSTIRRTAEATALKIKLIDHMRGAGTPTVVIGDLNDDPSSNTLSIISGQPKMTKRSRGTDIGLYSTLYFQQLQSFSNVYYTHEYNDHKSALDHILVSEEFFEHSDDSVWEHTHTKIWNDHVEDKYPYTSDHGIIKAAFK